MTSFDHGQDLPQTQTTFQRVRATASPVLFSPPDAMFLIIEKAGDCLSQASLESPHPYVYIQHKLIGHDTSWQSLKRKSAAWTFKQRLPMKR